MGSFEDRGRGTIAVRLACRADEVPAAADAWARRISAALETSFQRRAPVRWWAVLPGVEGPVARWIDVGPEGQLIGRVRITEEPGGLVIWSSTEDVVVEQPFIRSLVDCIGLLFFLPGLVLWVWLVSENWERISNGLSFSPDPGPRSRKGEIMLWALAALVLPVLTATPYLGLVHLFEKRLQALEEDAKDKPAEFARSKIDPIVLAAITAACSDAKSEVELGLSKPV